MLFFFLEVPVLIEKEGIRFEFKPNTVTRANETATKHLNTNDHADHVTETFQFGKHVKIAGESHPNQFLQPTNPPHTPIIKSFDFMTPAFKSTSRKSTKQARLSDRGLFFFGPHRRSLKSVDDEDEEYDDDIENLNFNGTSTVPNVTLEAVLPYDDDDDEYEIVTESTVANTYIGKSTANHQLQSKTTKTTPNNTLGFKKPSVDVPSGTIEEFYEEIVDFIMYLSGSEPKANLTDDKG